MTLDSYSFVAKVGWGREWLLILGCAQVLQWELSSCSLMHFFFFLILFLNFISDALLLWSIIRNSLRFFCLFVCLFVFKFFGCITLCRILAPDQGSNPCFLQWNQPLDGQGRPLTVFFFFFLNSRRLFICTQISITSELTKESKEVFEWLPTCNPDSQYGLAFADIWV